MFWMRFLVDNKEALSPKVSHNNKIADQIMHVLSQVPSNSHQDLAHDAVAFCKDWYTDPITHQKLADFFAQQKMYASVESVQKYFSIQAESLDIMFYKNPWKAYKDLVSQLPANYKLTAWETISELRHYVVGGGVYYSPIKKAYINSLWPRIFPIDLNSVHEGWHFFDNYDGNLPICAPDWSLIASTKYLSDQIADVLQASFFVENKKTYVTSHREIYAQIMTMRYILWLQPWDRITIDSIEALSYFWPYDISRLLQHIPDNAQESFVDLMNSIY